MTWARHPLRHAAFLADIGVRNRCATDRHEPVTYNPLFDVSFCLCGRITRPGKVARPMTARESCEMNQGRIDHHLVCQIHRTKPSTETKEIVHAT